MMGLGQLRYISRCCRCRVASRMREITLTSVHQRSGRQIRAPGRKPETTKHFSTGNDPWTDSDWNRANLLFEATRSMSKTAGNRLGE